MPGESTLPTLLVLATALLYSAVGQAGASGYLAAMGAFGLDPAVMKPTALALNLLVAAIGTVRFARAGQLDWRSLHPFALLGVPCSFLGGAVDLGAGLYYPLVGAILLAAAIQLARSVFAGAADSGAGPGRPPFWPSVAAGAGIGFLAGLTGTGGGVFLAPLLLLAGWSAMRRAAGVTSAFNLFNSGAALAGTWTTGLAFPAALPWWMAAAAIGALIGTHLGSRGLRTRTLRLMLAAVLAGAGLKMLLA